MKIYVDKEYITPDLLNEVPEEIKEKLKKLFFTTENIEKLKFRCEKDAYKAIVFDSSPKESFLYMYATDLDFNEQQEKQQDDQWIINYASQEGKKIGESLIMLLSENDFNITDSELPD